MKFVFFGATPFSNDNTRFNILPTLHVIRDTRVVVIIRIRNLANELIEGMLEKPNLPPKQQRRRQNRKLRRIRKDQALERKVLAKEQTKRYTPVVCKPYTNRLNYR